MDKAYQGEKLLRNKELVNILNAIIAALDPFYYKDFNMGLPGDGKRLKELEKFNNKVGIALLTNDGKIAKYSQFTENKIGTSTLALIATITDILIDKRLSWKIEDGRIIGVEWYKEKK